MLEEKERIFKNWFIIMQACKVDNGISSHQPVCILSLAL
jgi:hypothetical protein